LRRRRLRIRRPPLVLIRARKPWVLARFLFLGWYVLFIAGRSIRMRPVRHSPPGFSPCLRSDGPNQGGFRAIFSASVGPAPAVGGPSVDQSYLEEVGIEAISATAVSPEEDSGLRGRSEVERSWRAAARVLQSSLPEATYRMWIDPIRPLGRRGDVILIEAPAKVRTWVEKRYLGMILRALSGLGSGVTGVEFAGSDELGGSELPGEAAGFGPNPTHTFDRFVIGAGNRLAHSAALNVAEAPSEAYNPLFIHGAAGLGKTHLLGAIANYLEFNMPALRVRATTAEAFTEEFVMALRADGSARFKERYRNLDVLLIDDVQFLAGKQATEEEFFHTFNHLFESGSQIVLTADKIPAEISGVAERLASRFEWGLAVPIESPDLPTRITVLRRLVEEAGLPETNPDAVDLIASRVDSNLRQLRGVLTRVMAEASIGAGEVTREVVRKVLPERSSVLPPRVSPEEIRQLTATYFGISTAELESRKRDRATVRARGIAMYLTREMTDSSLPEIGRLYGNRNHSTILSSIETIANRIESDPELDRCLTGVRAGISRFSQGSPGDRDQVNRQ